MSFQAGFDKGVTWQPDAGGGGGVINITGWDAEDGGDTPEITHTGTDGEQAFLAGIHRCPCQIALNYDTAKVPKDMGLKFGAKGTITFSNGGGGNSVHVIIEKVSHKSVVNGVVSLTVTAKSDGIKAEGSAAAKPTFA